VVLEVTTAANAAAATAITDARVDVTPPDDALRCAAGGLSHLHRSLGRRLRETVGRADERDENERDEDRQSFHLYSFFLGFEDPDSRIIGLVSRIAAGPA